MWKNIWTAKPDAVAGMAGSVFFRGFPFPPNKQWMMR